MYYLYNVLATALVVAVLPFFFARMALTGQINGRFRESLGLLPPDIVAKAGRGCIWVHAASVGEIVAASAIIKATARICPQETFLVSVVTPTGYAMARRIIPEAAGIIYLPLDLPWLVGKALRRIQPRIFMMVETELWPNLLKAAKAQGVKTMMVNGRISDRSFRHYRYLYGILKDMLNNVDRFCMQSAQDARYIIALGADPARVTVTGNTKFDQTYGEVTLAERQTLQRELGIAGMGPVIVAGSTHKGEEEQVLQAFQAVRGHFPDSVLVLAPRHVERAEEVMKLCEKAALTAVRRTQSAGQGNTAPAVIILDTIGELGKVYSIADVVFVGGSLVAKGGHNILEPAAHGKAVFVGPHMFNFKESYALLSGRGACATVTDPESLANSLVSVLKDRERLSAMGRTAREIVEENKGAADKSAALIKDVLAH